MELLRLGGPLLDRIRREDGLRPIASHAVWLIVVGAGAYGAAFGWWRSPMSAVGSALKLPALILGVAMLTAAASALMAPLLRAPLSARQSAVLILVSFAVTSAILGALAPVSIFVAWCQPPPHVDLVGLAATDPLAAPSVATARGLVLFHTATIAVAGVAGVLRLVSLLGGLGLRPAVVHRVVLAWLALQLLVGAQLAWITRPFLGSPVLPVRIWVDSFEGSFFEEIWMLSRAAFGAGSPAVLATFGVAIAAWMVAVLRARPEVAVVAITERALHVTRPTERWVPWERVARARADGPLVRIELAVDGALFADVIEVHAASPAAALMLEAAIDRAVGTTRAGPFRTASG